MKKRNNDDFIDSLRYAIDSNYSIRPKLGKDDVSRLNSEMNCSFVINPFLKNNFEIEDRSDNLNKLLKDLANQCKDVNKTFFKSKYIGTEILIGTMLITDECNNVIELLNAFNIYDNNFMEEYRRIVGIGDLRIDDDCDTIRTPLFQRVLEQTNNFMTNHNIKDKETMGILLLYYTLQDDGVAHRLINSLSDGKANIIYESCNKVMLELCHNEETKRQLDEFNYVTNFNEKMKEENYNVVGMEDELKQLMRGLMRFKKPNVIIKGKAGIGKTALVEKLADKINKGDVPEFFKDKIIYQLDINTSVSGTKYRGEFEEKMVKLIKAVKEAKNIILFIDEIHQMAKAGSSDGCCGLGDILKPALSRGEISVIGATTTEEYDKYIAQDQALQRRFKTIELDEPKEKEIKTILKGAKSSYEKHYNVKITSKDIDYIFEKAILRDGVFPDKAFDSMEEFILDKIGV